MINKRNQILIKLLLIFVACFGTQKAGAQNCSVNSGVPFSLCVSTDTFSLGGGATGLFNIAASWSQVSGPNTSTILAPTVLNTKVTDYVPGVYVFRISARCQDGTNVGQNVTITIDSLPKLKVKDTAFCGNGTLVPVLPSPTLPAGQTVTWTPLNVVSGLNLGTGLRPFLTFGAGYPSCPGVILEMRISNGTCIARDTAVVSSEGYTTPIFVPSADQTICGTTANMGFVPRFYGCKAVSSLIQLSGPATATITRQTGAVNDHRYAFSSLIVGTYTFAYAVTLSPFCGSANWKDTFSITVATTVALPNPTFALNNNSVCEFDQDTAYFLSPTTVFAPGQFGYWDLTTSVPAGIKFDTIGTVLRIRTTNPGVTKFSDLITAPNTFRNFTRTYVVSNGQCVSSMGVVVLTVTKQPVPLSFKKTIVLNCGQTNTDVAQLLSGASLPYMVERPTVISRPAGSPAPTFTAGPTGSAFSGLVPGTYTFRFLYGPQSLRCGGLDHVVQVIVSATPSLSNAGTDQILACGVDSTTLAGNIPAIGTGSWEQVSGPSLLNLVTPNNPGLIVRNMLPGAYTLRWTIRTGPSCANSDLVTLFVTIPEGVLAKDTLTKCYGMPVQITGSKLLNPGSTGIWTQISGPPVTISNTSVYNPVITGTAASTLYGFRWNVTGLCNSFTDTVFIQTTANQGPSNATILTADICTTSQFSTLTASPPSVGTGMWRRISGPGTGGITSPTSTTTNVSLSTGLHTFVWEVSNGAGCDTLRDTVTVARRATYIPQSPALLEFCQTDTIQLSATSPGPTMGWQGTWTQTQGQYTTIDTIGRTGAKVHTMKPGVYQYRWTVGLGVCPTGSSLTNVIVYAQPSAANILTNDTLVCNYPNFTNFIKNFRATSPTSGTLVWSTTVSTDGYTPVIANPTSNNTNITLYTGVYRVYLNSVNGLCVNKDSVNVEIVPRAHAGADINRCNQTIAELGSNGNSVTLSNYNGSATPLWTQRSGPSTALLTNPGARYTNVLNLVPGRYVFDYTLTHPTCPATTDSVVLNNSALPRNVFAGNDTTVCYTSPTTSVQLKAAIPSPYTSVLWSRTISAGGSLSYTPSTANSLTTRANLTGAFAGLHQFRLTITNGACQATDFVDVIVDQVPKPTIGITGLSGCSDTILAESSFKSGLMNYSWFFEGATEYTDTNGVALWGPLGNSWAWPATVGNKKVRLIVTNTISGCKNVDSVINPVTCLALPVDMLYFKCGLNGKSNIITWATASESDTRYFVIWRSSDGKTWKSLDQVPASGMSYSTKQYSYADNKPLSGNNFYRLEIVNNDGSSEYEGLCAINNSNYTEVNDYLKLYPNPAGDMLTVVGKAPMLSTIKLEILGSEGRLFYSQILDATTGELSANLNISSLPCGMYILRISGDGFSRTEWFVKK